ncbi:MAG: HAD hydrolase-like protein [Spirochaetales bacterium]|nr:HAD hydrolase-like protein [Spirochaetales bacterium]
MADHLAEMMPEKDFFVGIDSDGCVFDTMEIKHKECFCPAFIRHFELQAISKYARAVWEFVNLYSRTRGENRFIALLHSLDLLSGLKEVKGRGVNVPVMNGLRAWVKEEQRLGNPSLRIAVTRTGDRDLEKALEWSKEVNETIRKMVRNVPPFPLVRESLTTLSLRADCIVVSSTPVEALRREWEEHRIASFVRLIGGQEMGNKGQQLRLATKRRYPSNHLLMIGDAPGDMKAARENNALFYPVIPGREEASWQRFHKEAASRFFGESYAGDYEQGLIREFETSLPDEPNW